jgi:hypothetical protein
MYMASVHITLNLEPEVSSADRERVLRTIRDRLRQTFGQKITVRTDEEASLWVVWLDDNFTRLKGRLDDVLERVESAGQARILNHSEQWFAWFDGKFMEAGQLAEDFDDNDEDTGFGDGEIVPPRSAFLTARSDKSRFEKTIIYQHDDDAEDRSTLSRTARRQIRIPTRK